MAGPPVRSGPRSWALVLWCSGIRSSVCVFGEAVFPQARASDARCMNWPRCVWGADAELHTSSQLSCPGPQRVRVVLEVNSRVEPQFSGARGAVGTRVSLSPAPLPCGLLWSGGLVRAPRRGPADFSWCVQRGPEHRPLKQQLPRSPGRPVSVLGRQQSLRHAIVGVPSH